MTQLPECPVWALPAKSLVHVGGMPYFTTALTVVEGFGDPVERLKPAPLTGAQSAGVIRAEHVAGIQLPSRRQIEHDLLVAMNHPLSVRRRTVTLLSRLRQYIERVEDRLMMSFTMPAADAASASPAPDQEVSVETKWPNG